ncbi:succinate dehydrogenase assembly factor 2 [Sediminicoccus sp. KRV36]|uniref:FAD assembly factor SdhE n=1 Tax=Sediminicoccus sp. KRV36 TaxID=3133721 RepID=UPI00200F9751|nr:succinate dehydrogenase assembly factor 2 [Sediminicoccus rosea]UPY35560.1 succinate dehydrogenase assembly factor 2 [Sediminicoccus rosea]
MPRVTSPDEAPELSHRQRRMLFRALHRGTKECDLMFGGFVRRHIASLTAAELDELDAIMELPDVDLADWLSGRRPIPLDARGPLLDRIAAESAAPGAGKPDHLK